MADTEYKGKWLYDIFLGNYLVGNQGDESFETKKDAEIDANDYILNGLSKFYNVNDDDFTVEYYQVKGVGCLFENID